MSGENSQALWLCFSIWNADCQTTVASPLCASSLPRSLGSATVHFPLLQECSLNFFAPPSEGSTRGNLIPPLSGLSHTVCSLLQGYIHCSYQLFSLLTSTDLSHLPTIRFNAPICQMCLCVEQEILCLIIAVQIVKTSRGENKEISLAAILLTQNAF